MNGFARREFQLVLLRRMADYRLDLVESAARSLGSSHTEMRELNAKWQRIQRSKNFPPGPGRLESVLGPSTGGMARKIGDITCQALWWPMPLWPDLVYEALIAPTGPIVHEWLIRPDPSTMPKLNTTADLTPWSCVVDDVAQQFPEVGHRPDPTPSRWQLTFPAPDGNRTHTAHFVWGLLQEVRDS